MSQGYQQLQSLDDSSVHVSVQQERAQELSTDVSRHSHTAAPTSNQAHSHAQQHSHQQGTHTHSHGGRPCNGNHGHGNEQRAPPQKEDKCGHNHGPGQSCSSKRSNNSSGYFIRFFTMFMPCNCIVLQYFWLNETLLGNQFEYYLSTISMLAILFMCFVTYYQCITVKNSPTKRQPPPCDPSVVDPLQRNNAVCKDCNFWKPIRTKHCRTCGDCQLRMDHHCPWITNCVGLRNNRAFYLFTVYMMIGAVQYCYRSFIYFQYLNVLDSFWIHNFFFYIYWFFTTIILVPITIMLIGLTIFHSILLVNNATTLDTMGGLSLGLPFSPQQKLPPNKRSVNLFNRGLISNVRDFFSGDLFLFWWPYTTYTPNDGTVYEMAPACTFNDIQNVVQNQIVNEDGIDLNKLVVDFEKRIEAEKERLRECNLQVDNKIFELWKDLQSEKDEQLKKEAAKQFKIQQQNEKKNLQVPSEQQSNNNQQNEKEINIF